MLPQTFAKKEGAKTMTEGAILKALSEEVKSVGPPFTTQVRDTTPLSTFAALSGDLVRHYKDGAKTIEVRRRFREGVEVGAFIADVTANATPWSYDVNLAKRIKVTPVEFTLGPGVTGT